jgi:hypothetical protein
MTPNGVSQKASRRDLSNAELMDAGTAAVIAGAVGGGAGVVGGLLGAALTRRSQRSLMRDTFPMNILTGYGSKEWMLTQLSSRLTRHSPLP